MDLAPAGDEQLAHGLAALDLLAAEALAPPFAGCGVAVVAATHRTGAAGTPAAPAPCDRDADVRGVGGRGVG